MTTSVDWEAIAKVGGTIVVLMGAANLAQISARLIAGGLSPDTPAAAVRWGTRPEQHTIVATLATLPERDVKAPVTIVIGDVAGERVSWFEDRPLFGRTVVVTRTRLQASMMTRRPHRSRRVGGRVPRHRDRRTPSTVVRRSVTRRPASATSTGWCSRRPTARAGSSTRSATPAGSVASTSP